jgi:methyl-accepting chemotaxis protein
MNTRIPLLRRLRLTSKMALMTFAFLATIAGLLLLLVPRALGDRAFTRSEQQGVAFLMPLRKSLDALQRYRGTAQVALGGDATARTRLGPLRGEVEAALVALDAVAAAHGDPRLVDGARRLQALWREAQAAGGDAAASFTRNSAAVEAVLRFYKDVADASNLTLDPELETFYLIETLVFNAPELVEHLGRVRAIAAGAAARKDLPADRRTELIVQGQLMADHLEAVGDALKKIVAANPAQAGLLARLETLQAAVLAATTLVRGELIEPSVVRAEPNRLFTALSQPIGLAYELYDAAVPALVAGLERRSQDLDRRLLLAWLMLGIALLAAAFSVVVTRYVVRPIQAAVGVANAIADGAFDSRIDAAGKDEAADLLRALERMQRGLKARIEAERAVAAENLRIRNALDSASTNMMIADRDGVIVYANPAVLRLLRAAESDIRKSLPQFSVDAIVGGSFDRYHRNPAHQRQILGTATATVTTTLALGGRSFSLAGTPVLDAAGVRLGMAVEWLDRTQELAVEAQVAGVIAAANAGDFSRRIETGGMQGFLRQLSEGVNELLERNGQAMGEIGEMFGRLADGDLTRTIDSEYQGTLAELRDDANATVRNLRQTVASIQASSDAINTAAREIAQGNVDLSARTEKQAASLEQTASSMEELTGTVRQNADNASGANALAVKAEGVAVRGGAVVGQMVGTMQEIQRSSSRIADIIGVIDGIAFQTNILALNAAVEAARAGEQGRGFAVVASEVRNLAQRSAAAAKEIKGLISDSMLKVDGGSRQAEEAGRTMEDVVAAIKQVARLMNEIADASREQSTGIEQVGTAVAQMDEVTQQNAALVEQAAAAAESLQDQATTLVDAVSTFRLLPGASPAHSASRPPGPGRVPRLPAAAVPAELQRID